MEIKEFLNYIIKNNIKGKFDIISNNNNKENFVIKNNILEVNNGENFDINILGNLEEKNNKFIKSFKYKNKLINLEFYNYYNYRDILEINIK